LIGGLVNGIDVIDFSPRVSLLIVATVIGVANPVPPIPEKKGGDNLHVIAVEVHKYDLTVAAHLRSRVCAGEDILDLLQERRLSIPSILFEAVVHLDGKQEVQVNIARWSRGGILTPGTDKETIVGPGIGPVIMAV
jgi:hypothetical protein